MNIDNVFKTHRVLGIAGNRSTAKSSLALAELLGLRKKYPDLNIAVFGVEESLETLLTSNNITILRSKMDILDLRLKDTIIFVDEMALFFDTKAQSKQQNKLMRFFDRLEHNNCYIVLGTAREGYWNKFMCGRITAFLVKEIEYDALVNGTWLKERVQAVKSNSDYRLECAKNEYYVVTNNEGITSKYTFKYIPSLDTKKENRDLFNETKGEK